MTEKDFRLTAEDVEYMTDMLVGLTGKEVGIMLVVINADDSGYHTNITPEGIVTICRDVAQRAFVDTVVDEVVAAGVPVVRTHEIGGYN